MSINGRASDFCSLFFIGIEWNVQFNTRQDKTKFNTIQYDMIITKMNFQQCFAKPHQGTICRFLWYESSSVLWMLVQLKENKNTDTPPLLTYFTAGHTTLRMTAKSFFISILETFSNQLPIEPVQPPCLWLFGREPSNEICENKLGFWAPWPWVY